MFNNSFSVDLEVPSAFNAKHASKKAFMETVVNQMVFPTMQMKNSYTEEDISMSLSINGSEMSVRHV